MRRCGLIVGLVAVLCVLMVGMLLPSGEAEAYFSSSEKKDKQCFTMQWLGKLESSDTGKAEDKNGQRTNIYYRAFATRTFCTNKLKNPTKISMSQTVKVDGATEVGVSGKGGFTISTTKNGKGIKVTLADGSSKTFKLSDSNYNGDFKKLADDVQKYLPNDLQNVRGVTELTMEISKYTEKQKLTKNVLNKMSADAEMNEWGSTNNSPTEDCYKGSGAMGWVLCPIVSAASRIGEDLWKDIIEYHLKIPAQAVFESDGGVEQAWSAVRNIANIVFIILFLFVIFSQLTGVGIDNYGIKKIMPKLIVVAILMNLSYIICELAVDVSNILGVSLNNLLSGFAYDVDVGEAMGVGAATVGGLLEIVLGSGGVLLFAFLKEGSLAGAAGAIGLAAFGILIVVVVAILILYAILTIREAGIILLTVLSPVALVCYMLPNTEKYYKKWFDIFKALLVVYPICGAMVGAGQLAGAVLSTVDSAGMKVSAMIVQVLPFFLIPVVLKNSLSLLGNAGAKISSFGMRMGRRASSGVQNAVKNTDRYKDWSGYQKSVTDAARARRTQTRLRGRLAAGGTLSGAEQNRLRRAEDVLLSFEESQIADAASLDGGRFASRRAAMEDRAYREGLDQDIASMKRNGIVIRNERGEEIGRRDYGVEGIQERLAQLSRMQTLDDSQRREVASLSRAALNDPDLKGGGRAVGGALRSDEASAAFKMAMGDALQNDSAMRAKLSEKDAAAASYGESFMANGNNRSVLENGGPATTFEQHRDNNGEDINKRIKSYEMGISQSGAARGEYLDSLQESDFRRIVGDERLMNGLAPADRQAVLDAAKSRFGIEDPATARTSTPTPAPTNPPRQNARPVNPVPSGFAERDSGLVVPHDIHRR